MNSSLRQALWTLPLAFFLWFVTFGLKDFGNFWLKLAPSAALLALIALGLSRSELRSLFNFKFRHLLIGPISALFLYGFFWLGNETAKAFLPFASDQIHTVYGNKSQLDLAIIGLLLLFVMGPAEEIYWRGLIQRSLGTRFGYTAKILLATSAYALVHVFALNLMLMIAAAVCGLFWGWLYEREQSLIPVIISHSLWDLSIFVWFPLS
ncbi:CPBP family intramembrane metalloprotease [Candidatus Acetothermia bacterium]|nr:CPBP family intramembrane metalloprotease [Candidatus Acetothermia bacterium]MBI3659941.1 CPBP family intramembrane metalloprotease [Candidatus Acetothermia bacterium]